MDVNKVILIGNLTNDPVTKKFKNGNDVAYVGLATNLIWKKAGSDKTQSKVEFHNLVFWGKISQVVEQYLKKGDKLYIEGRLQTRTWEDDKKLKHYKTEVIVKEMVMLGGKKKEDTDKATAIEEINIEEE